MRVVLLAKERPGVTEAVQFLKPRVPHLDVCVGVRGDPFPAHLCDPAPDILVSYLSPWIVPGTVLDRVRCAAVNFHPGPPDYPGSGCTNFALYHEVAEFGVTAHLMLPVVDSGGILAVRRFSVLPEDTVASLTRRCYDEIQRLFPEVMARILVGETTPDPAERWTRRAYTRKELDELCRLTPDMSEDEVRRRIRATVFPGMPGPYIDIHGYRFEYGST